MGTRHILDYFRALNHNDLSFITSVFLMLILCNKSRAHTIDDAGEHTFYIRILFFLQLPHRTRCFVELCQVTCFPLAWCLERSTTMCLVTYLASVKSTVSQLLLFQVPTLLLGWLFMVVSINGIYLQAFAYNKHECGYMDWIRFFTLQNCFKKIASCAW